MNIYFCLFVKENPTNNANEKLQDLITTSDKFAFSTISGRYCHMFLCVHCLKENVACTQNGQCCKGQCTYGRCKKDAAAGAPGTFCDRHDDCRDPPGTCCVRFVKAVSFYGIADKTKRFS